MCPQARVFGPAGSRWPTSAPSGPRPNPCWCVLNLKAALACLQLPSLSGCASSLSAWRPWPRLSCKVPSSVAVLLRTRCQHWVAARSWQLPFVPLIDCLSKRWPWGYAPLRLVPIAGGCKDAERFSPWWFGKRQSGSGYGSGEVPPHLDKPGECLAQRSKRAAMEGAVSPLICCLCPPGAFASPCLSRGFQVPALSCTAPQGSGSSLALAVVGPGPCRSFWMLQHHGL